MRIVNDFSYLNENKKLEPLEDLCVYHLRFDASEEETSKTIMDLLTQNFKVYQYKDCTTNRNDYELFFWSNKCLTGSFRYFTISFCDKSIETNYEIMDKLLLLLMDNLSDLEFEVAIQYTRGLSNLKVENYIMKCEFDINKLDIPTLGVIEKHIYHYHKVELSEKAKWKLIELSKYIKGTLNNKRVVFNNMRGTIRSISDGEYGFFKLRAKTRYYHFELYNVNSIEI